jgi:hypothetical protein
MLTKAQKAYADEVFARAGKPSPALQQQINQIRSAKSEDELKWLFSSDANVVRPKAEAELLCVVMLAKLDELNPSINAGSLKNEQSAITKNPVNVESPPTLLDNATIPYNKIASKVLDTIVSVSSSICDKMVQGQLASKEIMQQNRLAVSTEFASLYLVKAGEYIRHLLGVSGHESFHVVCNDLAKAICKYGSATNNTNEVGLVARSIALPHGFKPPQTQFYYDEDNELLGVTIEHINIYATKCNSDINKLLPTCIMEACLIIRISRILGVEEMPSIDNRSKATKIIWSAIFPLLNVDEDIDIS